MKYALSLLLVCDSVALIERALDVLVPLYVLERTHVQDWEILEEQDFERSPFIFWSQQDKMPLEEVLKRSNGCPVFVIMDELDITASQEALQAGAQEVLEAARWVLLPTFLERWRKTQLQKASTEESALLIKHADQAPGVVYQFQVFADGKVAFPFVSDRMGVISAIPVEQLRVNGNIFFDYLHKDDYRGFIEMGKLSRETLCNWSMDFRLQSKEGGYRWMHASSKPVHLSDGSWLWYGYMEDITDEKQAKADVKDSEEQVRTLFENAPDGIAILDQHAVVVRWNPKAVEIFGWEAQEIIGKYLYEVITPRRNHSIYRENVQRFHRGEEDLFLNKLVEMRACPKGGGEFPITISISVMYSKGELFFLCFMGDITKRKQAQRKVQESLKEKEVLLKEIHHRVKNNLQVITSLLSLQSSFITDTFISDIFKKSQYRINSMGMVHEMLYQSKDLSKIDYKEYLERLTTSLKRAMVQTTQTIEIVLDLPAVCFNVDTAIPLSLILNELLTNAFKYAFVGRAQGIVKLRLEILENENYSLVIEDNGTGYSLELTKNKAPSLGLLLVQKLAIQLCGSIERLSIEEGTAYRLLFQEIIAN
ncbi:MAG: PAS domain S-box protein [Aureispira sp.]